jgi:hypothetical protein
VVGNCRLGAWNNGVLINVRQVKQRIADSTKDLISKLLAAGYVVVAPDYEGLGTCEYIHF